MSARQYSQSLPLQLLVEANYAVIIEILICSETRQSAEEQVEMRWRCFACSPAASSIVSGAMVPDGSYANVRSQGVWMAALVSFSEGAASGMAYLVETRP